MTSTPLPDRFQQYVDAVLSGTRPACLYERQAVKRHVDDLTHVNSRWVFDDDKAWEACEFIELLPHVKGRWARLTAGERLTLSLAGWQVFIIGSLCGWVDATTRARRFNIASVYVPRKNGKSTLAGGLALYFAFADGEPGAEVYSGATTEKQAWEVFGPARRMVMLTQELQEELGIAVNANNLIRADDGSRMEAIVGKPGDGASPHLAIVDEYHEHTTSSLYDTMLTGMGAREQPLLLVVSTAGSNLAGPCAMDWEDCKRILATPTSNERKFAILYTVDNEDDWTSETALVKANPNYDVSVSGEFLRERQREAITDARKQATFKTKHLNLWVNSGFAFFNIELWDRLKDAALTWDSVAGRRCIIGVDLASKVDLASTMYIFLPTPEFPTLDILGSHYVPEQLTMETEGAHYRAWVIEGHMVATDGDMIDHERILSDTTARARVYNVAELAFDPYQAVMLVAALMQEGIECVEYGQTVVNLSDPMKYLEAMIRAKRVRHNGDPVLRWCLSNVEARVDVKDNVYPRKAGNDPARKIDAAVALIQAVGRYIAREANRDPSLDAFLKDPVIL